MKQLDLTLSTPEENLALDEALLDLCDTGGEEVLRFWESDSHFVVLGYSNKIDEETNREICAQQKIKILRRVSGGGTVLQGPGCLNYSLILNTRHTDVATVTGTNHFVMSRLRSALAKQLHKPVTIEGHTDLAINGLKFSGNAQRRKQNALLFHGTLLYHFDFEKVEGLLKPPPRQPEYRAGRSHRDFLMNLNEDEGTIKSVLAETWKAKTILESIPREAVQKLIEEKYSKEEWNSKF